MQERLRPARTAIGGNPTGLGNIFEASEGDGSAATVDCGPYSESLPVGGMSVATIRRRYRDRFDIDPNSLAYIDGTPVTDENTVIRSGQKLRFSKNIGVKGQESR